MRGYYYSGQTFAYAYTNIIRSQNKIKTIYLLGPFHDGKQKSGTLDADKIETPLGDITVKQVPGPKVSIDLAMTEHSLEMHYNWIKYTFPDIEIVPIYVGFDRDTINLNDLGFTFDNCLLIVSTDFNHWGTRFGYTQLPIKKKRTGEYLKYFIDNDSKTETLINLLDYDVMEKISNGEEIDETQFTICGLNCIRVVNKFISSGLKWKFIYYDHSKNEGDGRVGYVAMHLIENE